MRRGTIAMAGVLGAALAISGCAASSSSTASPTASSSVAGASSKSVKAAPGQILIGGISTLTGAFASTDIEPAIQAVFQDVNKAGGIDGHMIKYVVLDDGGSVTTAQEDAHRLVDDGAVALVDGGSNFTCTANGQYFESNGILDIEGVPFDNGCYASPAVAPVNTGALQDLPNTFQWLTTVVNKKPTCLIAPNIPGLVPQVRAAVSAWQKQSGQKLGTLQLLSQTGDPSPIVIAARNAGCKGVVYLGGPQATIPLMQAAQAQGMTGGDIAWVAPSTSYTSAIASKCGSACSGMYAVSEFEPYSGSSAALGPFLSFAKSNGLSPSGDAEGSYLAAMITVKALRSIAGPITRAAVTQALKSTTYSSPLLGSPWTFSMHPEKKSKFVQDEGGHWVTAYSDQWYEY
jgi:branched-chain amino acid transport system substrate-binding protein